MENTATAKKIRTIDLVYIAVGAALIAVCAWISIPFTVPFTMQTFGVFFVLSALGGKRGTCSVLVYLLLGAVGMPVFAGFSSGIGILLGNTGGYLLGFLLTGVIYLVMTKLLGEKLPVRIAALAIGLAVCYAFGTVWFLYLYTKANGAVGLGTVLSWCVLPFVIPDVVKLILATLIAGRLRTMISVSSAA
ncbi:MAG: biotin transporter BioY [Oscillospiraceae bacterium]|nr:biotin transporter BioY [Oscillospiraceae bacterium]